MITKRQFNSMSMDQRIAALETSGVYLMNRNSDGYMILLYGMSGFYAEVLQTMTCRICSVELMTDDEVIDSYLSDLCIEFA